MAHVVAAAYPVTTPTWGANTAAAIGAVREEAGEPVSADGGANEGEGHSEPGGVGDEARVLKALVELFELPLEGTVAHAVGRGAAPAGSEPPGRVGR